MDSIKQIAKIISNMDENEAYSFLTEILSESELAVLSKRWRILKMLKSGITQREISKELNVSLCKVTRGSKILKTKNAIVNKYLIKE